MRQQKPASQADAQSDSQWRVVQQASGAMTKGLQARNEWGWDKVHSPGTHCTPHQGTMRNSCGQQKDMENRGRKGKEGGGGTLEEELCEWVGG